MNPAPQITGVVETCLHVESVERSAKFYERLFGFERMAWNERFCALNVAQGSVLLLFRRGRTGEPVEMPGGIIPPHDGSGHLHFAFAVALEDFSAWERKLTGAGIAIESRVRWELGGQSLYFRDPDRHLVECDAGHLAQLLIRA